MRTHSSWLKMTLVLCLAFPAISRDDDFRVEITPEPGGWVGVEATIRLGTELLYMKDIGRGTEIRWTIGRKELGFQTKRAGDLLYFSGLPASGVARLSYQIKSFASYFNSGDRRKLREAVLLSPSGFLALTGFFPGVESGENGLVDIRWRLPRRWNMISGREGLQKLKEAEERIWVAGRTSHQRREEIRGSSLTVTVLDGATLWGGTRFLDGLTSYFRYAWERFGPLESAEYDAFILPRAMLTGFALTSRAIAVSDELGESTDRLAHEMLHWWSGYRVPYWIREGLIAYLSRKVRFLCGQDSEAVFQLHLQSCLADVRSSVEKAGGATPLAEMSDFVSPDTRFADLHPLGTLVAYKLDREIRSQNPSKSLEDVFAAIARNRGREFDLQELIKKETSFDPKPFFEKYVFGKIENPEDLLKME